MTPSEETRVVPRGFDPETGTDDWADPRWAVERQPVGLFFAVGEWDFSVAWGPVSYCAVGFDQSKAGMGEYTARIMAGPRAAAFEFSTDAEVALFRKGQPGFVPLSESDDVRGHVEPASLLAALEAALNDEQDGIVAALRGESS